MSGEAFKAFEAQGWSERAGTYDALMERATAGAVDPVLDAAGVGPGVRLLDVGAGLGTLAAAAAARGARVTGADLAEGMVAAARARHPELEFVQADAEALPFSDGAFDVAVGAFLVNHVPHPERAVAELARVARRVALAMWGEDAAHLALPSAATAGLPAAAPAGPDSERFTDPEALARLLPGSTVRRHAFTLHLDTLDELWDGIRGGTVRTAARLAAADDAQRADARAELERLAARHRAAEGYDLPITFSVCCR